MTGELEGQVRWSDLDSSFGRTCRELLAAISETDTETSDPCWRKLYASQNQPFLYLDCRANRSGQRQEPLTVMDGLSRGELTTLNTGESPNVAVESRLLQILEVNAPEKYYLSARACQGILTRANRRGKKLPDILQRALEYMIEGRKEKETARNSGESTTTSSNLLRSRKTSETRCET